MPTPYERATPPALTSRPRLERPLEGRLLGGVCAGIAAHLGLSVKAVRIVVAVCVFGPGLPGYLFLWALVPEGPAPSMTTTDGRGGSVPLTRVIASLERSRYGALLAVGGLVSAVGILVLLQVAGVDVRAGLLVPLLAIAAGAVVVWSDLDDAGRARTLGADPQARGWVWLRSGLGLTLAIIGLLILVLRGGSVMVALDAVLAALAILAGVAILGAPWGVRWWAGLRREQEDAARARERADIAAHLHDSVLQTLALIQRRSHDPASVTQLARAQERELRSWLYAGPVGSTDTLAAAVTAIAHEVEDLHGEPIDLVVTGDRPLEEDGAALTRALREALLNAVRHGGAPVTAYVEIGPHAVEAFVRDRGTGFDLDEVPPDRLGVRQSIIARMTRHGGSARVRRLEDGTEVELTLPVPQGASLA